MIGIRFRPSAIAAFTKVSISEFTDNMIDARLFESLFDDFNYEMLSEPMSELEQIASIDSYISRKLNRLYPVNGQIVKVVAYIKETKGMIPINELLNDVCLCQRQFERQFKSLTGVTPKMFSAITRYIHTKKYLKLNSDKSLFSIAFDCGFYDHAHLIRDFRRFGGTLPKH